MQSAFLTGFFLAISLILAIGAQNAFVLRQGIIGQHVFYVALFCAISDTLLISLGVIGFSYFLNNVISEISSILFGFSAAWLGLYGLFRLKAAFTLQTALEIERSSSKGLLSTLSIIAALTFINPHVYLDTMILIGSVSQQFSGENKLAYVLGASLASFVFFFSLAYGARLLAPIMKRPFSWQILDCFIAIIMFTIGFKLLSAGNWL
jgi:L-lysine exporter family protein LysE/ArgO